jgi:predicted  nucleic acid-binding Zn-ribbon protein
MQMNGCFSKTAKLALLLVVGCALSFHDRAAAEDATDKDKKKPPKITYDEHVKPILRKNCFSCHDADKKKGDLDMTTYTGLMQGGGSGEVIESGESSLSYLYALITHTEEPYMPPESPKIPDKMIETIRKWIDGGVLENSGSKAKLSQKPKFDLALKTAPSERPKVLPMPGRLSLEPVNTTKTTTAIAALATSPWAPLAAVAGQKQVLLYNTKTLELLGTLPFPEGTPQTLKFSRNGSLLLAGGGRSGARGLAIVWNVKTGKRVFEIGDELDTVLAADISSDQTLIALGGPKKVVRIYSTETGRLMHELRKHTDWIYSLEFSPDSVLLATGDRNGGLYVWEAWTGREYLTLKGHGSGVTGVSWRSDSNILASCSEDSTVRLWEMNNGGQVKSWGAHGGGVAAVEFARDGRILSCGRDRVTKLWNQAGAQQRAFEAFGDLAIRATFCDETNRAIAGDWSGAIRVWNAADGKRVGELSPNPPKLDQRLQAATQQLAAFSAEHAKSTSAQKAAEAALAKVNTDLGAAKKLTAEAQKRDAAAIAAAKQHTLAIATVTAEIAAAAKIVATVKPVVPLLQESLTKGQQAAAKAAGDKELAAAVKQLKSVLDKRKASLATSQKTVTDKTAALKKVKLQLTAAQKQSTDAKAAVTAGNKRVGALTAALKPAQTQLAAAQKTASAAAQKVTSGQQQVARWQDEIAFARKFDQARAAVGK